MSCLICGTCDSVSLLNFHTAVTLHSIITIKDFCKKIFRTLFQVEDNTDELICECCYYALNELDHLEKKSREIIEGLKKKFHNKGKIEDIMSMNNEELKSASSNECINDEQNEQEVDNTNIDKIHFSDENDLRTILDEKLNLKNEASDWEGAINDSISLEEHDVDVLYDMMDAKNVVICMEKKKNEQNKKLFQCKKCSDNFNTREELKLHGDTHNNDKPFICEVCGKVYRHKTALDIHVGMHNGINPFKCLCCHKSFTQKGALIRHVKIHTGEKPFQCDECGKCFTHHTSFNIHKISHSGQKSYKCEVCGLGLISTSHLKRHMRVHTGEKKYACNTCGKRFAERYNLVSHSKLHTLLPGKRKYNFRCDVCGITFSKRLEMNEHILMCHSSTNDDDHLFISMDKQEPIM